MLAAKAVLVSLPTHRTQEALKSGRFVDVLSILLRLQRICNHPGLVAPRLPESSYTAGPLQCRSASLILKALDRDFWKVRRGCGRLCLRSVLGASGTSVSTNLRPAFRHRLMLGSIEWRRDGPSPRPRTRFGMGPEG